MSLMLFCSCMLSVSLMLSVVKVNFTTMMGGLAQTNQVKEAPELFRLMLRKGIHVDFVSLSSILGVCAKGERDVGLCHGISTNAHTIS